MRLIKPIRILEKRLEHLEIIIEGWEQKDFAQPYIEEIEQLKQAIKVLGEKQ